MEGTPEFKVKTLPLIIKKLLEADSVKSSRYLLTALAVSFAEFFFARFLLGFLILTILSFSEK
jgi:hypothetical protein